MFALNGELLLEKMVHIKQSLSIHTAAAAAAAT